ncbi:hypothetical protein N7468_009525 [Penicillium chermesinum]|uniref:MPN domain-containing protein n=1 Tax=Penicillium chermesinum TaxID=63820 RepID=A0A9W9NHX6_9EURO|nr:uncharacterized protein N7468_009525 [Penicillium chermesinum]KAJ5220321.1 hypothetical protein N7468_009525 [Penicillium chermesinum]
MAPEIPSSPGGRPPMSVEMISKRAQDYEYNGNIALRYWLRTASTLIREAQIYEREGNDEQAYLLLFRHAQLVLVHLSVHPDAQKDGEGRAGLLAAEKQVKKNLVKLESLKPRINKRYERYTQLMRERQSRKLSSEPAIPEAEQTPADPALSGVAEPLEAGENRDLAVKLAQSELTRRATLRKTHDGRRIAGEWSDWESALQANRKTNDTDLSQRIQSIRSNIDHTHSVSQAKGPQKPVVHEAPPVSSAYKYPTVPLQKPLDPISSGQIAIHDKNAERQPPPVLPPKETAQPRKAAPLVPEKKLSANANPELNPSSYTFKPSAYLENGTPLRSVFLPAHLRTRFLSVAAANTHRNLETCGILCGTLVSNALFISRLVIPDQVSTSDTCETTNESALFDYCDTEDLIMLGWIHTHPTQTCFMSSRDLHTHSGYQVMLPESIAIVCAPSKDPDWGVFRLTDPPGLKTVLNCTQGGLFHPHAQENIYTGALRPGHVVEVNGLEFETVDLRAAGSRV